MPESIFLLNNGQLIEMNESTYLSEDLLQKLLADYPSLISGSQIDSERPRRWLLVSREFGVPDEKDKGNRWSLDHLFIDQDGIPTLVEVKRSVDTRLRREVIGQILDYAANAVSYWTIEEIRHRFEECCNTTGKEMNVELDDFLQGETEAEQFWENTKTNLKAGKIRMLIIADVIPKELQRIIEFLNEQMSPAEILGVEIKQFIGQDLKTLVPRVIGMTSKADSIKGRPGRPEETWTEERFLAELLKTKGQKDVDTAKKILAWISRKVSYIYYGTGKRGALAPILKVQGVNRFCFALWVDGFVEIYFQHMKNRPVFDQEDKRLELLNKLNTIPGVAIPQERVSARPNFPLAVLNTETELQKFMDIFDWYWKEQGL
ncbi:MAG: hypothetical protein IPJ31_09705 [Bacteroidetes bacterium]|nr:hypothetical protein [Bacteroidota bacterium]